MSGEASELILLLVRHGETHWNAERRWQGQRDIPLSDTGREQAARLRDRLRAQWLTAEPFLPGPPAHFFASPLSRARETAEILATALTEPPPLTLIPDLRERGFGDWEGMTMEEIHAKFGPDAANDSRESWGAVAERMNSALAQIRAVTPSGVALVVGHGGSLRFFFTYALGASPEIAPNFRLDNTGLSIVVFFNEPRKGAVGRIQSVNDTAHRQHFPAGERAPV